MLMDMVHIAADCLEVLLYNHHTTHVLFASNDTQRLALPRFGDFE